MLRPITQKTFLPCCEYLLRKPLLPCCGLLTHKTVPLCFGGLARTVFADAFRQKKLDSITVFEENERAELPIRWSGGQLELMEASLRRKLRSVDFFIEVRDARIPASTLHPQLRRWAGKKPKILVFNRSDMITHKERMEWERHLEERNLKVIWTAAPLKKSGIPTLIRRLFDANFEVNRRRRKTNLQLRPNRTVLACLVGHPNVGKRTLFKKIIGDHPKRIEDPIPDKGRPDLVDRSLHWYKVEGGVYLMEQSGIVPPWIENATACLRLAFCGNYEKATVVQPLVCENLIMHLGSIRDGQRILEAIYDDVGFQFDFKSPSEVLQRFAEQQFQNDVKKAANHILSNFQRLKYGPVALEMPYMLQDKFQVEEQLVYDKDTATGLQSGICTQY